MQRILYAIQSKATEEAIQNSLQGQDIIYSGAVTYREAILASLKEHPADILLYRESLKGMTDTFELMKNLRINFPQMRIVFLANEQPSSSPLLCKLVCLGIYDIVNSNAIPVGEIVNLIVYPRDFAYAVRFFNDKSLEELLPQSDETTKEILTETKKKGLLGSLLNRISGAPQESEVVQHTVPEPTQIQVKGPEVDFATMRSAMLEEARRTAQAELPQLIRTQVEAETKALKDDVTRQATTISGLRSELKKKSDAEALLQKQLTDAAAVRKGLEDQLSKIQQTAEIANQTYEAQLLNLQTTKPPEWYQEQTTKWLKERESLMQQLDSQSKSVQALTSELETTTGEKAALAKELEAKVHEIESLQLSLPRDIIDSVDEALDDDFVIIPDQETNYQPSIVNDGQVIVFMGTKHGVGNTTVALNTAIALANCGQKTLFIELNRQFPLINEFFEFTNIVRGLDTAVKALTDNNFKVASQCIIKPHGLVSRNRAYSKIYKRLPGPLHFLLYSNDFLLKCKSGSAPYLTDRELKDLIYFLTRQERYTNVIVDLQPDDTQSISTFLCGTYHADQLVLTMTQDTHSIRTAGLLITSLARSGNLALVRNAEFIINQFSSSNKMTANRISDYLHVPANRFNKISLDTKGYMDASFSAVPYMLKGKFCNEYIDLRMKLTH